MRTFTFTDVRRRSGTVMAAAEEAPVMVMRRGVPAFVVMSVGHHEALAAAAAMPSRSAAASA